MFRPMLAPPEDPSSYPEYFKHLRFPLLVSPKFDGIRCIIRDHRAYSRTMKLLPSLQVQEDFTSVNHLDGELIEGDATTPGVYNRTMSLVMSVAKPGELSYHVFDYVAQDCLNKPFYKRLERAIEVSGSFNFVEHTLVENVEDLLKVEDDILKMGYEGLMMRDPVAPYKMGRGTFREGYIYKLKRFFDAEGVVIDVYEGNVNNNKRETDERGYAKRSSHKDNLAPSGMVGGFIVDFEGVELNVAPGCFTHDERTKLLKDRSSVLGRFLKFRGMRYGMKDVPRFCRAVGFRDPIDL